MEDPTFYPALSTHDASLSQFLQLQAIILLLVGFILLLFINPSLFLKPLQLFSAAIQSCLVFFILYLTLAFPNALSFHN
jgi:hypothetical protein